MKLIIFALCVFAVSAGDQPEFCRTYECPVFTVIEEGEGYEVREYAESVWVTTAHNVTGWWSRFKERNKAFRRLFKYITGDNDNGTKIEMTVPVRITACDRDPTYCPTTHRMGFYIPKEHWGNIPEPLDPQVTIQDVGVKKYYVRQFGGYALQGTFEDELGTLKASVDDAEAYASTSHIMAVYNSPWELFGRHNEIMVEKLEPRRK